jgi:hypothetical protein
MSRSRRKPIIKDRPRNAKKSSLYWRVVRRVINDKVRQIKSNPEKDLSLPEPKEIVNDYDYCDYKIDYRDPDWKNVVTSRNIDEYIEKQKRK